MTTTLSFEISVPGKTLTCQADADNAVTTILALLGLTGSELMLDTDVYFNHYTDISNLVTSGAWLIRNRRAYCIPHWPSGRARKHFKRRCDLKQARKLYPDWLAKLKQLERLGNQLTRIY
ncbi:MAG: hypothetical protein WCP01_16340 [Methylococcaceae bacterium]